MSGNTIPYEVISGNHTRIEGGKRVRYKAGQTFVPTDGEIATWGKKLRPVLTPAKAVRGPVKTEPVPEPISEEKGGIGDVKAKPKRQTKN